MSADERVRWLVSTPAWKKGENRRRELAEMMKAGELIESLRRVGHVAV